MLACGKVDGVFQTGNFGSHTKERFAYMQSQGIYPLMCMEYWCGWFDHWGCGKHAHTDAAPPPRTLATPSTWATSTSTCSTAARPSD